MHDFGTVPVASKNGMNSIDGMNSTGGIVPMNDMNSINDMGVMNDMDAIDDKCGGSPPEDLLPLLLPPPRETPRPFNVIYYDTVGSTNDTARELAASGYPHGTVVVADAQERGRGRHSRVWFSPRGLNLYMSIILRDIPPRDAPLTGLAASLAASRAVQRLTGAGAWPKWPNDIYVGQKKLGGILLESSSRGGILNHLIVGIGINVNIDEDDFPHALREIATSIAIETNGRVQRGALASGVLSAFQECMELLGHHRERFKERWTDASKTINTRVRAAADGGRFITGTAVGIDDMGRLMLADDDGRVTAVGTSEVINAPCR
jgi:BirA family biotin operon repressor/biotin-[acetyl-CoA-carboxylase] ligase